jgi:hypothetical protein
MEASGPKNDGWPTIWQEIHELIGPEATENLLRERGGTRIYIPKQVLLNHPLTTLLGLLPSQALVGRFGGDYVDLPLNASLKRALRNREILRMYDTGDSVRTIALQFQTTERNVYRILSDPRCVA